MKALRQKSSLAWEISLGTCDETRHPITLPAIYRTPYPESLGATGASVQASTVRGSTVWLKHPKLLARVASAFPVHPVPEEDSMYGCDYGPDCYECQLLQEHFGATPWDSVDDIVVLAHHSDLPKFAGPGFRYYLPAYLSCSLRHWHSSDDATNFTILGLLPSSPLLDEWYQDRLGRFTDDQRGVILDFLRHADRDLDFESYNIPAGIEVLGRVFKAGPP